MPFKKSVLALILALGSIAATAADVPAPDAASTSQQEQKYNAHHGPYSQAIDGVAHLKLKEGYLSLDQEDTHRYMEEMQNPGVTNSWYFSPEKDGKWFAIIDYDETGHVSDDEKIDADAVLDSIRKGTEQSNKARAERGWAPLTIVGWRVAPHYETDTKRLSWATLAKSNGEEVINYTTKVLGRTGVATITLVSSPQDLDASVAELKDQLSGFQFDSGQGYSEFKDGDKLAEYGLTGLIVGGAAAVAAKSGFFKWIGAALLASWKFIAIAAVALIAGLKSMFGRKDS